MKKYVEEIAARTRERIAKEKSDISVSELENRIQEVNKMQGRKSHFSRHYKRWYVLYLRGKEASPQGQSAPDFPYLAIAKEYEQTGASAISCLTEPFYFQEQTVSERNRSRCTDTCTSQGFTVDEYMIYQAKSLGASVLLIAPSWMTEN